jgi:3-methyladenine DNA glycosylase AlkD
VIRADVVAAVRQALAEAADPAKAGPMQAYMKSALPYRGVQATAQKRIWKDVERRLPFASVEDRRDTVLALWRGAEFREERYGAIALARFDAPEELAVYEELIVTGAWWDYVDWIASHRVGPLVRAYPRLRRTMRAWARDRDLWKRRTAIIHQLGFKSETDTELLAAAIEPSLDRKEFFLRKAIGWALREYAKTDPEWVVAYVEERRDRLSPLSQREALKNVLNARR